jgi:hypothetical protein
MKVLKLESESQVIPSPFTAFVDPKNIPSFINTFPFTSNL